MPDQGGVDQRSTYVAATRHELRSAFAEFLLDPLSAAARAAVDPGSAFRAIDDAYRSLEERQPGEIKVVVSAIKDSDGLLGTGAAHTVLEVTGDDRPLMFSTVLAAVERVGATVLSSIHPIIGVERRKGTIRNINAPGGKGTDESFMHIELAERLSESAQAELKVQVTLALDELRAVESATSEISTVLSATAKRCELAISEDQPEWAEAAAWCRWIRQQHFLLTGVRRADGTCIGVGADADALHALAPGTSIALHRSRRLSRVHRSERTAVITIADPGGGPPTQFVGLTTLRGRAERPSGVPWVRQKFDAVMQLLNVVPRSHGETTMRTLFDELPWDILLIADGKWLAELLSSMVRSNDDGTTVLRLLPEADSGALTAVAAVRSEDYRPSLDDQVIEAFRELIDVEGIEQTAEIGDSGMATISVTALLAEGSAVDDIDLASLGHHLARAARSWPERVVEQLSHRLGAEGPQLWSKWSALLPPEYIEATDPRTAAADIVDLNSIDGTGLQRLRLVEVNLPNPSEDSTQVTVPVAILRLVADGPPPQLSKLVPAVESHGLIATEETTYRFTTPAPDAADWTNRSDTPVATVLGLSVQRRDGERISDSDGRLVESLTATWDSSAESDPLNCLVISAGLAQSEVKILRAYARYLAQLDPGTRSESVNDALAQNPEVAAALWAHIAQRFGPAVHPHDARSEQVASDDHEGRTLVVEACDAVTRLDHDRLLRSLLTTVDATVRVNFWASRRSGAVAIKFDGTRLTGHGNRPSWREIWVTSPEMEGIHLRAGPIARGGLRWSDREGDVRTEVHQLMEAQRLKNALIVPTGAKGGFVLRRRPTQPDDLSKAVKAAYRTFVNSLLDLTDNLVGAAVVHPEGVRIADDDDTYLVVAADRGTSAFSDLANEIAGERNFWLGDAFASGGSAGYDHKELGVTARGAWVSVAEHFAQRGIDVAVDPITVVGIGDMSGDVFGNGLLRSTAVRLVAAFDHRHVMIDPEPDSERSFVERQRLFELPRSSWDDIDRSTMSTGAMVHPRATKQAILTEQVAQILGVNVAVLSSPDLVRAVMKMPVDLIYLGGIGTFIRASDEADADVGDPANSEIRLSASEVRASVIGEGANLGVTPLARVELAAAGIDLNSDAIDNSAGVDTSDQEVNLKILLGLAESAGRLTRAERDALLAEVALEIVDAVLEHVASQNRALTRAVTASTRDLEAHVAVLADLAQAGRVDRHVHALPSGAEVRRRRQSHGGLLRPELAVLMAAEKARLTELVLVSRLPDRAELSALAVEYVPTALRQLAAELMAEHPLRREIIATQLVNEIVDRMGLTWVSAACRATNRSESDVIGAYWMARSTADLGAWWRAVDDVPVGDRETVWGPVADLVGALADDYLRRGIATSWTWSEVQRNAAAARVLAHWRPDVGIGGVNAARPGDDPVERADALRRMALAAGLAEVADANRCDPEDAVGTYVRAGAMFGIDDIALAVLACQLSGDDPWGPRLREHLFVDLDRLRRAAARLSLRQPDHSVIDAALKEVRGHIADAVEAATTSLDPLAVVTAELWLIVERLGGPLPQA